METNLAVERDGKIGQILVKRGTQVAAGDLLTFERTGEQKVHSPE